MQQNLSEDVCINVNSDANITPKSSYPEVIQSSLDKLNVTLQIPMRNYQ